jgi:hypothetical protein
MGPRGGDLQRPQRPLRSRRRRTRRHHRLPRCFRGRWQLHVIPALLHGHNDHGSLDRSPMEVLGPRYDVVIRRLRIARGSSPGVPLPHHKDQKSRDRVRRRRYSGVLACRSIVPRRQGRRHHTASLCGNCGCRSFMYASPISARMPCISLQAISLGASRRSLLKISTFLA